MFFIVSIVVSQSGYRVYDDFKTWSTWDIQPNFLEVASYIMSFLFGSYLLINAAVKKILSINNKQKTTS